MLADRPPWRQDLGHEVLPGLEVWRQEVERNALLVRGRLAPVRKVEEFRLAGRGGPVDVRCYRPLPGEGAPALVWMHGGSFMAGSLATADNVCRHLAAATPCTVVSAGYALAPERPFPAGLNDVLDALDWLWRNAAALGVNASRITTGGGSPGANLAVAAMVLANYPQPDPASRRGADAATLRGVQTVALYADGRELADPCLSPLQTEDLSFLPPAYVVAAGRDPLCADGVAYVGRLRSEGVGAVLQIYEDAEHGFFTDFGPTSQGPAAVDKAAGVPRKAFREPPCSASEQAVR